MIIWDFNPNIISIGPLTVRWYGLLFALSFIIGYQIFVWIYKREGRSEKELSDLIWYMIIATVVGARLGHCLFYNPSFYFQNPFEIIAVWHGGLASHGAAVGILVAIYYYVKKRRDISYFWLMDRIVITVALAAFFIRLGNLFNSEIIGLPTDVAWAFVFTKIDDIPRHPAQLYEAIAYLITFVFLFVLYKNNYKKLANGFIFGLFLLMIFGSRFFIEFLKEDQTYFEEGMFLNMGQLLSIPLIVAGIYFIYTRWPQKTSVN
ncbi:MAG: prolipoprotein diacylglyceryl transferase [Melioribacteraceae bacterium]|nr:prolipoprotein diacylglyceryl transferase [Melioribacteraceae bacterium]WKZ69069.1 MAG: prolipoprotein diacylglyceryl transferase [Melioribacteraceae bacterium]